MNNETTINNVKHHENAISQLNWETVQWRVIAPVFIDKTLWMKTLRFFQMKKN